MPHKQSRLELLFDCHLRDEGLTGFVTEYKFNDMRQWRFDFAWPGIKVAAEIEGGIYSNGRHTRAGGFISDCDKYNTATLAGWAVYRFTSKHINDESAIRLLKLALKREDKCQHDN